MIVAVATYVITHEPLLSGQASTRSHFSSKNPIPSPSSKSQIAASA
jgi:hypothetical protein